MVDMERIYQGLYDRLPDALPEFGFREEGKGYVSTTGAKITGESGKAGKVYVYRDRPGMLKDYTRGAKSIWNYLQEREGLSNGETLKLLSQLSGVPLPEIARSPEALERLERENKAAQVWEAANAFLMESLKLPEAGAVLEYLKGRGYEPSEVEAMELGYIPSQEALKKALWEDLKLNPDIGKTHKLTIPYKDRRGIRGIAVRDIKAVDGGEKYRYSTGLQKAEALFSLSRLTGDKDLTIVEGLLDCLIAQVRGVPNVAGLGGTSLNATQVEQAVRAGAKRITLCLDNDRAGREATLRAIDTITATVPELKVYVAQLPEGIKDPDQAIKELGVDKFKGILSGAQPFYFAKAAAVLAKYPEDTYKNLDSILEELHKVGLQIADPQDRDRFIKHIGVATAGAITPESFKQVADKLRADQDQARQKERTVALMGKAKDLIAEGNTPGALELLSKGAWEVKASSARSLIEPYSLREDWIQEITATPDNLSTGIEALDGIALIPQGAMTLIAGRPSHGKSTLMFNLLLNMAELYPDKRFYFFSYEEEKKFIYLKLLNIVINEDLHATLRDCPGYDKIKTNLEILKAYYRDPKPIKKEAIGAGLDKLNGLVESGRLTVIDRGYSVEALSNLVGHLHLEHGNLGAVFIDYIQRMTTEAETEGKRVEIATISRSIVRDIAIATGLPVIVGAQLNRAAAPSGQATKAGEPKDAGKRPTLENLKEAGNLEEDANTVIALYNASVGTEPPKGRKVWPQDIELELHTLKVREGEPNKKALLNFDRYTGRISNLGIKK